MTSTAGVDRCYHHQRYVDTCHDCRYTVEGVAAANIEDERDTLKARVAELEKFVVNLYPDVIHLPDCDVLGEGTGAACTCGGQARIDALLPKEEGEER